MALHIIDFDGTVTKYGGETLFASRIFNKWIDDSGLRDEHRLNRHSNFNQIAALPKALQAEHFLVKGALDKLRELFANSPPDDVVICTRNYPDLVYKVLIDAGLRADEFAKLKVVPAGYKLSKPDAIYMHAQALGLTIQSGMQVNILDDSHMDRYSLISMFKEKTDAYKAPNFSVGKCPWQELDLFMGIPEVRPCAANYQVLQNSAKKLKM
jgi:hypothetical protein